MENKENKRSLSEPSPVDAVEAVDPGEFAEWCSRQRWYLKKTGKHAGLWVNQFLPSGYVTTAALLDLYKQSLTNTK